MGKMNNKISNIAKAKPIKTSDFDFDYWCKLAKKDPEAFEAERKKEIDNYISSLKDEDIKERMSRLQWRVERERDLSKNPMDSAVRLYDMMWDAVSKNYAALQDLATEFNEDKSSRPSQARKQAQVLAFPQAD